MCSFNWGHNSTIVLASSYHKGPSGVYNLPVDPSNLMGNNILTR